jgi:putative Mn2+ efflux pump MntP
VFALYETILWDLIGFFFSLAVGVPSLIFYIKSKKSGLLVIAIAFFIDALVTRILFGQTMIQYLFNRGVGLYELGLPMTIIGFSVQIAFTILMVIGLFMLYKELKQQTTQKD